MVFFKALKTDHFIARTLDNLTVWYVHMYLWLFIREGGATNNGQKWGNNKEVQELDNDDFVWQGWPGVAVTAAKAIVLV